VSTAPQNSDIVISKSDGSTNKIGLTLYKDNNSVPGGWKTEHVSPAPPRQVSDSANYQQQSPDIGLVLDQDTWHRGFGAATITRFGTATEANRARARYGYSENVLSMFRGELVLGYQQDETDILISNGRFEKLNSNSEYDLTDWDTTNASVASSSTYVKGGNRGVVVTAGSNNGYIEQEITFNDFFKKDISNSENRKKFFAHCYLRRVSGSGNAKIQLVDPSGS
jgi:hypothetical protein